MAHDDHQDRTIESLQREVERLQTAIEKYFNFAPGGYVMWEQLITERDQARDDWAREHAAVLDARAAVERLRGALEAYIIYAGKTEHCPFCYSAPKTHHADCKIGMALTDTGGK